MGCPLMRSTVYPGISWDYHCNVFVVARKKERRETWAAPRMRSTMSRKSMFAFAQRPLPPIPSWTPAIEVGNKYFWPVLRIRIHRIRIQRIHMFFGLPESDPLVRGMDPDPSFIMQIRKTLILAQHQSLSQLIDQILEKLFIANIKGSYVI